MENKKEKGTEKIRPEPPVVGFGGEVTLGRLAVTGVQLVIKSAYSNTVALCPASLTLLR